MPRPIVPPRGAFISSRVIFHPTMPANIKETLIILLALAWSSHSQATPPLTYSQMAKLTGKSVRRLFSHIAVLRDEYAALRLQSTGNGIFVVTLADWLFPPPRPGLGFDGNQQLPVKEEEESSHLPIDFDFPPPPDDHDLNDLPPSKPLPKFAKRKPAIRPAKPAPEGRALSPGPEGRALSSELLDELAQAGVFASLFAEVAASPYDENALRALLAWAVAGQPTSPAAIFIARLRQNARPPAVYFLPPCPRCGLRGQHAPDCRKRYYDGEFADFVEH
jgi:hypothetical protein